MDFARRFFWFLIGVGIGTLFVIAWLSDRDDFSCTYFPDNRVKQNILRKEINFDSEAMEKLSKVNFDTLLLKEFIDNGDVIFKKSNTRLDSCKTYYIESEQHYAIFENCDSLVNILEINAN